MIRNKNLIVQSKHGQITIYQTSSKGSFLRLPFFCPAAVMVFSLKDAESYVARRPNFRENNLGSNVIDHKSFCTDENLQWKLILKHFETIQFRCQFRMETWTSCLPSPCLSKILMKRCKRDNSFKLWDVVQPYVVPFRAAQIDWGFRRWIVWV